MDISKNQYRSTGGMALEVPYSPNQFLGWDFFSRFLKQTGSSLKQMKFIATF